MVCEILNQENGIIEITNLFKENNLIPFLGAGFTKDCPTEGGVVPDSEKCNTLMKKILLKNGFDQDEISNCDLFRTASYFSKCSENERCSFFEKYFLNTKIEEIKKDFLNLNWNYIYTLNIDDGIESAVPSYIVIPPFTPLKPKYSQKILYKIHGDVRKEITQKGDHIIFNFDQYINALTDEQNQDMLNRLKNDYSERNIIFIGCSLRAEADLKYIYNSIKKEAADVKRIWISDKEPKHTYKQDLEDHGITTIVIVSSYDDFYEKLVGALSKENNLKNKYNVGTPEIKEVKGKENALKYMAKSRIYNEKKNEFFFSDLHIKRSCVNDVIEKLKTNDYIIIRGRHLTGKTYVLASIIRSIHTRNIYFFPSTINIDADVLDRMFKERKHSLFVFDSNSVEGDVYNCIIDYKEKNKENDNKMIIVINSNDMIDQLDAYAIDISPFFDKDELLRSEEAANSIGFLCRRKNDQNIDYLIRIDEQNGGQIFQYNQKNDFSQKEIILLFLLSIRDVVYSSDALSLQIVRSDINNFVEKMNNIVEFDVVGKFESQKQSSFKLVHNSKLYINRILERLSRQDIIDAIKRIVLKTKNDKNRSRIYKDVIMFDNINSIYKNAADLLDNLYEELQPILSNDLHYWLQRAKCIYRNFNYYKDDVEKIQDAYSYANKVCMEAYETSAIFYKANLTKALISACLFEISKERDKLFYQEEAINSASIALLEDKKFIFYGELKDKQMVKKLKNVCETYTSFSLSDKAEDLLIKISRLKQQQTRH